MKSVAILFTPKQSAWEFWPALLFRADNGGWLWGCDGLHVIDAANDANFFGPLECA